MFFIAALKIVGALALFALVVAAPLYLAYRDDLDLEE